MKSSPTTLLIVLLTLGISLSGISYWWLKQTYTYPEAQQVAHQFFTHLRAQEYEQAFALSAKPNLMAKSPQELAELAQRECLDDQNFAWSAPPQTQGNRLRRWINGQALDMDKVSLEFENSCLLGVQLSKTSQGQWRVLYFGAHAG
ncbi:hypothetical protein [uncultured Thiothrix sp.]|uniref:hypothetical protein n=1 Tax=uncultured Thiothrix sp. TaxID=223185 RepID=UPI0026065F16|nr:hypothetical protein [uncultured Thiothrix sp.]